MPPIRWTKFTEIETRGLPHSDWKAVERAASVFTKPLDAQGKIGNNRSTGTSIEGFIAISERVSEPPLHESSPSLVLKETPDPATNVSSFRSFMQTLGDYFRQAIGGAGSGLGAPMMIFSFLLTPRSSKVENLREYQEALNHFNDLLRSYDEVLHLTQKAMPLSSEQQKLLTDTTIQEIARQRMEFVRDNHAFHVLESADRPDHPLWQQLETPDRTEAYGSEIFLGPDQVFHNASQIIRFSEQLLDQAYRGEIEPGDKEFRTWETEGRHLGFTVEFVRNEQSAGTSQPGSRVVLRVQFDRPIGRLGIAKLRGGEAVQPVPGLPIYKIDGEKPPTDSLFLVGGPRRVPIGSFDLLDIIPGPFGPQIRKPQFWSDHAMLSGIAGSHHLSFNPWLERRDGYEVPLDELGRRFSLVRVAEGQDGEDPLGVRQVRIHWEPEVTKVPGPHFVSPLSTLALKDVQNGQKISLTVHREQLDSFRIAGDKARYLLIPLQKSDPFYGLYREQTLALLERPSVESTTPVSGFPEPTGFAQWVTRLWRRPAVDPQATPPEPFDRNGAESAVSFVEALGPHGETLLIFPAGKEPQVLASDSTSLFTLPSPSGPLKENYTSVGDVKILTHNISGEQRIKLTFVVGAAGRGRTMRPTGQITLTVEGAVELGIVVKNPQGKLFIDPKMEKFFVIGPESL